MNRRAPVASPDMHSPASPVPRSPAEKDKPTRQHGARRQQVGKLTAQSNPFLAADAASKGGGNPPQEKRAWEHPKENHASVPKRVRLSAERSLLGESQNIDHRQSVNITPSGATAAELHANPTPNPDSNPNFKPNSNPNPSRKSDQAAELRELEAERLEAEAAIRAEFAARRAVEGVNLGAEFAARRAAEEMAEKGAQGAAKEESRVAAVSAAASAGPGAGASLAEQRLQPDAGLLLALVRVRVRALVRAVGRVLGLDLTLI